jgi:hypothetical protein
VVTALKDAERRDAGIADLQEASDDPQLAMIK